MPGPGLSGSWAPTSCVCNLRQPSFIGRHGRRASEPAPTQACTGTAPECDYGRRSRDPNGLASCASVLRLSRKRTVAQPLPSAKCVFCWASAPRQDRVQPRWSRKARCAYDARARCFVACHHPLSPRPTVGYSHRAVCGSVTMLRAATLATFNTGTGLDCGVDDAVVAPCDAAGSPSTLS